MAYLKFQVNFNKPGFGRLFEHVSGLSVEPSSYISFMIFFFLTQKRFERSQI